ncbi:MAG: mechanosensitive ion channel [Moraxella osloensis]
MDCLGDVTEAILDIAFVVAGLGIAGIAVGFAAQATLANFIAGITILIEQSFQVGDWVSINEKEGKSGANRPAHYPNFDP